MTGFGLRLAEAKARRGPLCLGIDPHPELLRGWDLATTADGLAAFCDICVRAFADFAVVKPQVAFFESYGAAGFAVLERTIAELRAADVLVLADAKRGDIGATMSAYATAWVGDSPLAADAVTASPYLGFGSLRPLLEVAAAHGRGGVRAGGHLQSRRCGGAECRRRRPQRGPVGRGPGPPGPPSWPGPPLAPSPIEQCLGGSVDHIQHVLLHALRHSSVDGFGSRIGPASAGQGLYELLMKRRRLQAKRLIGLSVSGEQ